MKKVFAMMLIVLVGGFAVAQDTVQEWGYVVYNSAGNPAFELEPMGGGELIPLSGMGAEFFDNIGALVQVTGYYDGDTLVAEGIFVEPDLSDGYGEPEVAQELIGAWSIQIFIQGEWYELGQVSYFEDGTYFAVSDGEEVEGDWWVDGQMLYSVDAGGYTEAEWSHFEEGVIQTVTTYWEDASGAQQDVSELPEFFLVPM